MEDSKSISWTEKVLRYEKQEKLIP